MANGFVLGRRNNPTRGGLRWVTVYEEGNVNVLAIEPRAPSLMARIASFTLPDNVKSAQTLWRIVQNSTMDVIASNGAFSHLYNGYILSNTGHHIEFSQDLGGTIYIMTDGPTPLSVMVQYAVIDDLL